MCTSYFRFFLLGLLSLLTLSSALGQRVDYPTKVAGHPPSWRPGVLMIRIGGLRGMDGIIGGLQPGTAPALEKLAATGRAFTAHYATASLPDAGLVTVLNGKWNAWSGIYENNQLLSDEWFTYTLPQAFVRAGYRAGGFGRVVTGLPTSRPFPGDFFEHYLPRGGENDDTLAAAALAWSGTEEKVAPTAVLIGLDALVFPWANSIEDPAGRRAAYARQLAQTDALVGRLIEAWSATPAGRDGIVMVWSDHGTNLGEQGQWGPGGLGEASTRVPLIIRAPNVSQPGVPCAAVTSNVQLYATLAALCRLGTPLDLCDPKNMPPPEETLPVLHGRSLAPWLLDPTVEARRPAVMVYGWNSGAVRHLNYRYIRWRDGREEFYDLAADPAEKDNLALRTDLATIELKRRIARHMPLHFAPNATFLPGQASIFPELTEPEKADAERANLLRM